MSLYWYRVDLLQVTHDPIFVLTVKRNLSQFLILVTGEYFWNHAGIGEAQDEKGDLNKYVQDDGDDDECYWSFKGGDDVV